MDIKIAAEKAGIASVVACFTAAFGWFGWLIVILAFCLILDWITGSAAACKNGEWRSSKGREGIWHKFGTIVAVIGSGIADLVVGLILKNIPSIRFEYTVLICPIVVAWYIFTELGSIIENAGKLGAPVPKFLTKIIASLKISTEKAGESIGGSETTNLETPEETEETDNPDQQ